MDRLITITTFQYPHEVHIIKSKLEAAGIKVFLKDELTVQSHNFLSNAVGGVKLQVRESDVLIALPLLKEMGVNVQPQEESKGYLDWIDAKTNKIPVLKNLAIELRMISIVAILLIPILTVVYLSEIPKKEQEVNKLAERAKVGLTYELESHHLPYIDSMLDKSPQKAIEYVQHLLETDYPENKDLYFKLGYGYIALDSFRLAKNYIANSMDFDYPTATRKGALAYCLFELEEYEEAIQIYTDLQFSDVQYKVALAEAYVGNKEFEKAVMHYSEYISERRKKDESSYKDKKLFEIILKRDSIKSLIKK